MNKNRSIEANAAIYYTPELFNAQQSKVLGFQVANEGMLKAVINGNTHCNTYFYSQAGYVASFNSIASSVGSENSALWLDEANPASPSIVGNLHYAGPMLPAAAWRRRKIGQRAYSITGVTHTTASVAAMDQFAALLTAPVQTWDALICTSKAVRETIEMVLDRQQEYLYARMGARHISRPQLPIIPLGVDTSAFSPDLRSRHLDRESLGIDPEDVAVLFLGRLSFQSKAHPFPMYAGLEFAAKQWTERSGRKVHLIQVGWFPTSFEENAFKNGAENICPSVNCIYLDGGKEEIRRKAWNSADIFTSLADNIQETFGLTPVEAMAAGLPSVVSDWDGYRDTIRDGIDGFRIPTCMPRPGQGLDLVDRYESGIDTYGVYCAQVSHFVSVDVAAAGVAYFRLMSDPKLRIQMGEAARMRAVERFDWKEIVRQYRDLWGSLNEQRQHGEESAQPTTTEVANPARTEPFTIFGQYATNILSGDDIIAINGQHENAALQTISNALQLNRPGPFIPTQTECTAILFEIRRRGQISINEIALFGNQANIRNIERIVVFLHKFGLIIIEPK